MRAKPVPAQGFDPVFGYNAVRVPLYLMRAGLAEPRRLAAIREAWKAGPGIVSFATGAVTKPWPEPGYRLIAAAMACVLDRHAHPRRSAPVRADPLLPFDPPSPERCHARGAVQAMSVRTPLFVAGALTAGILVLRLNAESETAAAPAFAQATPAPGASLPPPSPAPATTTTSPGVEGRRIGPALLRGAGRPAPPRGGDRPPPGALSRLGAARPTFNAGPAPQGDPELERYLAALRRGQVQRGAQRHRRARRPRQRLAAAEGTARQARCGGSLAPARQRLRREAMGDRADDRDAESGPAHLRQRRCALARRRGLREDRPARPRPRRLSLCARLAATMPASGSRRCRRPRRCSPTATCAT